MNIETTADLRRMLIETIEGIKDGTIDSRQGQAIATLSSKIIQSAKLDLDALRFNSKNEGELRAGAQCLQLVDVAPKAIRKPNRQHPVEVEA